MAVISETLFFSILGDSFKFYVHTVESQIAVPNVPNRTHTIE